jgi:4-hydroxy-4-methyl-2-oxoglutarate aldolase
MPAIAIEELCNRYSRFYTGAISDCLDKSGLRDQVLPYHLRPSRPTDKFVGPAFTGYGESHGNEAENDTDMRVKMLEAVTPGCVSIWQTGTDHGCAHWGEIMSKAARNRGCVGAVIDGGVRDLGMILEMNFPVFFNFNCPASSIGRWSIREFSTTITIGKTRIEPGDLIVADVDGVVVVPKGLADGILYEVERLAETESNMRDDLTGRKPIAEVYRRYGTF